MIRKEGKVYNDVKKLLEDRGMNTCLLEVAALGRGPNQLILMAGETIGEYNFRSKRLFLYDDMLNAPE